MSAARWLAEIDGLAAKAEIIAGEHCIGFVQVEAGHVRAMVAACKALVEYVVASDDCVSPTDANGETSAMLRFGKADDAARRALASLDAETVKPSDTGARE